MNWKGTKGKAEHSKQIGEKGHCLVAQVFIDGVSAIHIDSTETVSEATSNAILCADAINTIQECDLLPSELLEQRNELLEVVKSMVRSEDLWIYNPEFVKEEHKDEAIALNNILSSMKRLINKAEQ